MVGHRNYYSVKIAQIYVAKLAVKIIVLTSVDVLPSRNQALCEYCMHGK